MQQRRPSLFQLPDAPCDVWPASDPESKSSGGEHALIDASQSRFRFQLPADPVVAPTRPSSKPALFDLSRASGSRSSTGGRVQGETKRPAAAPPEGRRTRSRPDAFDGGVEGVADDEELRMYWVCCCADVGVIRLDKSTFVVQDWDERVSMLKPSRFFHVRYLPISDTESSFTCDCTRTAPCVHTKLLGTSVSKVVALEPLSPEPYPRAFLLAETHVQERYIFSVRGSSQLESSGGKRTIVYLLQNGQWRCRSCATTRVCHHKEFAIRYARDAEIIDEEGLLCNTDGDYESLWRDTAMDDTERAAEDVKQPISFHPIPGPLWCRLPHDTIDYVVEPAEAPPEHIPLMVVSRCCCGETFEHGPQAVYSRPFTVFGLRRAYLCSIDVANCTSCCHHLRQYGPDGGELGIFNWNNMLGFTHKLLNQYTNVFTTSSTPFVAFVAATRRLYTASRSPVAFCTTKMFINAWFAFTALQPLDSGMECPTCGPHPDIVIADGVSIGYSSAKFVQGLQPPTLINDNSPKITTVRAQPSISKATISSKDHRNKLRVLTVNKLLPVGAFVSARLQLELPAVARLVALYIESPSVSVQAALRELIRQIAADDIVLLLVPYSAISLLACFATSSEPPPHLQLWVPAMGNAILSVNGQARCIEVLKTLAAWLAYRSLEVFNTLSQHAPAMPDQNLPCRHWRETGVCYGSLPIRARRHYPNLAGDGLTEDKLDKDESECGKYYSTYKKTGLTGGIMVLWCRHLICLGFHTIPTTEGRNDVFSTLYTHWPVAPRLVVYDFGCQLAPYAWVREAQFFRDTRFVVDQFHASGHTKCSRATSATFAMQYDPNLQSVNTSAAEIGNSGVSKI